MSCSAFHRRSPRSPCCPSLGPWAQTSAPSRGPRLSRSPSSTLRLCVRQRTRQQARTPALQITFFNGYGRIYESGPGSPVSMADGPGVVVKTDIAAAVVRVWAAATDSNLLASFSDEFISAEWDQGHDGPGSGASFRGRDHHELLSEWEVRCFVDVYDEPNAFGWCTTDPESPGARWRFEMQPLIGGGTELLFRLLLGAGPWGLTAFIEQAPDKGHRLIADPPRRPPSEYGRSGCWHQGLR